MRRLKQIIACAVLIFGSNFIVLSNSESMNLAYAKEKEEYFDPQTSNAETETESSIIISKDADFTSWTTKDIYPLVEVIQFEEGTECLDSAVFRYFPNVKKVILPMSIKEINKAFTAYEYGEEVKEYDQSLTHIDSIEVNEANTYYASIDGVLLNKDKTKLIFYPPAKVVDFYKVPESVVELGYASFEGASIKKLEIPSDTHLLEYNGYIGYETELYMVHDALCKGDIGEISVSPNSSMYSTVNGVLYNKEKTWLVYWPNGKKATKLTFPSTLSEFELQEDFPGLNQVQEIVIPKNCKNFYTRNSDLCALKKISIEKGNKNFQLKDGFLYKGSELYLIPTKSTKQTITVPKNFKVFSYNVNQPNILSVKKIIIEGNGIGFPYECFSNLESFELKKGNKKAAVVGGVLYSADKKTLVWYPQAKKNRSFTVPSKVTKFSDNVFYQQKHLVSLTLPKNLKLKMNITYGWVWVDTWFVECNKLKEIKVDKENTSLKAVDGVLYTNNMKVLICYPPAKCEKEFIMPDEVEQFIVSNQNSYLTKLTLGANFNGMDDATHSGSSFYDKLDQLSYLQVSPDNKFYFAKDNVLYVQEQEQVILMLYPLGKKDASFVIPEYVYDIPYNYAIYENKYLKNLSSDSEYICVSDKLPYHCNK